MSIKPAGHAQLPKGFGLRESINAALWFFLFVARPLCMVACRPRSVGLRRSGNWMQTLGGLGALAVWAGFSHSPWLLTAGGSLACLAEIAHRLFPFRQHSRMFGDAWLVGLCRGNNLLAHQLQAAVAVAAGLAFVQFSDTGVGTYLVAAAFGYVAQVLMLAARMRHVEQDQLDAEYAGRDLMDRVAARKEGTR